ncbi:MAG: cytosine permease [Microcella sp.]|uniref:cytosine permease n=1 Tax=Microcella sp. TaxID=1913979 RepID=UPI003315865B
MVDEQQPPEEDDTLREPPGPRRSTYTPPPADAQHDASATDDDALAGALAQEFRRWTPPPRRAESEPERPAEPAVAEPGVTESAATAQSAPPAESAPQAASASPAGSAAPPSSYRASSEPAPAAPPAPGPSTWWSAAPQAPSADQPRDGAAATVPQSEPNYSPSRAVPAEPLPPAERAPSGTSQPPVAPQPFPVAQSASPEPDEVPTAGRPDEDESPGIPAPPRRESMTDEQLLAAANLDSPDHDTSALLDLLEQQLRLREAEVERLGEWERQVRETAGPEAEPLVAEVRAQFTGSIPVVGGAVAQGAPRSPLADQAPPSEESAAPAPPSTAPADPVPADRGPADQPVAGPAAADSAPPQSGPELDLALADAPPPFGATAADVPPPSSAPADQDAPPPLVEPEPVAAQSVDPEALTGPTSLEAIFGAAVAAEAAENTGGDPVQERGGTQERVDNPTGPLADEESAAGSATTERDAPEALGFEDLLREPEPEPELDTAESLRLTEAAAAGAAVAATASTVPPAEAALRSDLVEPSAPPAGRVEPTGLEPTPAEQRAGASVRLFWLWFAVNASVVSIGLGAVVFSLGMSLRQAILATLVGVAVSFLPLGLGTLASKWSGQPTVIISRATFGTVGNAVPAVVAVVSRALWASALLWMLAAGVAEVLVGGQVVTALGRLELSLIAAGVGLIAAALIAGFGFGMIAVVSAVVSVLAGILVVGIIVLTVDYVDLDLALSVADGPWTLLTTGAILVFSVVGLAWAHGSGDVARYQATGTSGAAAVLWATFGATIPSFLLIGWGAVLAASNPFIAEGLVANPVDLLSRLLPLWYPIPLIAAIALSLVCAAALALYSGGFAVQALGARMPRPLAVLVLVVVSGALLAALLLVLTDLDTLFRDVLTTLAVPIAAWVGIFGAEIILRAATRSGRLHAPSLLRGGGIYPAIRWVNFVMLVVATAIGWGFTTAAVAGLQWQGYLWSLIELPVDDALLTSDVGVALALGLGLLTPLVAGVPGLRRLQRAERAASGTTLPTTSPGVDSVPGEASTGTISTVVAGAERTP